VTRACSATRRTMGMLSVTMLMLASQEFTRVRHISRGIRRTSLTSWINGPASLLGTNLVLVVDLLQRQMLARPIGVLGEALRANAEPSAPRCQVLGHAGMLGIACGRVTSARMVAGRSKDRVIAPHCRVASGSPTRREGIADLLAMCIRIRTALAMTSAWLRMGCVRKTLALHSGRIAGRPSAVVLPEAPRA